MGTLENGESALRLDDGLFFSSLQDDYCLPVPSHDPEYERLNVVHEIYKCSLGLVPDEVADYLSADETEKTILDVGSGTGIWAAEMANEFYNVEVTGVDLVNCPLASPPGNTNFIVRDVLYGLEDDDDTYDVVHVRDIALGIRDYSKFLAECVRVLKPGGYLILAEIEWVIDFLDDRSAADECPELFRYTQLLHTALSERGLDPLVGYNFEYYTSMVEGLTDVTTGRYYVPIAPGHPDPALNHLGELSFRTWELFARSATLLMRDHGPFDSAVLASDSEEEITGEQGLYWYFDQCVARKAED